MSTLAARLSQPPFSLPTTVLSIDDLYLPHHALSELAASHPTNPLVQHRGQPATHDIALGLSLFSDLREGRETRIPKYDKSAHNGQGDRVSAEEWDAVNRDGSAETEVVIFEGWCVGFRALPQEELQRKWQDACKRRDSGTYEGRLGWVRLENVQFVNENLRGYDELTNQLDALIHLDAENPMFVYQWRIEQEVHLRDLKGSGMTDEQVIDFVNNYYPAYELFTDGLRAGIFGSKGKQLRLVIGKDRKVKEILRI